MRCSRAKGACCRIHFSKFVQGPAICFSRRAVAPFDSGNLARGADRIQFLGRNNTGMTTTANASGSILVVDDQPANLRVVTQLLSRPGHEVTSADTGQEPRAIAPTQAPNLSLVRTRAG